MTHLCDGEREGEREGKKSSLWQIKHFTLYLWSKSAFLQLRYRSKTGISQPIVPRKNGLCVSQAPGVRSCYFDFIHNGDPRCLLPHYATSQPLLDTHTDATMTSLHCETYTVLPLYPVLTWLLLRSKANVSIVKYFQLDRPLSWH